MTVPEINESIKSLGVLVTVPEKSVDLKIHDLAKSGLFRWNGKKFAPASPSIRSRKRKKIADIIVDNRG